MKLFSVFVLALTLFTANARAAEGQTHFGISAPVLLVHGSAYWGGNLDVFYGATPDIEIGLESGFHDYSNNGFSQWVIPIQPTALYSINVNSPSFTPFIGLGLGVGLVHSSVAGFSNTDTDFYGTLHLGAKLGSERNFFVDMRLGDLDGTFVFGPSIGIFF